MATNDKKERRTAEKKLKSAPKPAPLSRPAPADAKPVKAKPGKES
jgi:hypothetical protein